MRANHWGLRTFAGGLTFRADSRLTLARRDDDDWGNLIAIACLWDIESFSRTW